MEKEVRKQLVLKSKFYCIAGFIVSESVNFSSHASILLLHLLWSLY